MLVLGGGDDGSPLCLYARNRCVVQRDEIPSFLSLALLRVLSWVGFGMVVVVTVLIATKLFLGDSRMVRECDEG